MPPMAPQRPIDELESLTSQPATRRRILKTLKRKKKADHTKEIILGSVVAVAGSVLFIVYLAMTNQDHSGRGWDAIKDATEKPANSSWTDPAKKHAEDVQTEREGKRAES